MHKKEDGSYYVVSANKPSSVDSKTDVPYMKMGSK